MASDAENPTPVGAGPAAPSQGSPVPGGPGGLALPSAYQTLTGDPPTPAPQAQVPTRPVEVHNHYYATPGANPTATNGGSTVTMPATGQTNLLASGAPPAQVEAPAVPAGNLNGTANGGQPATTGTQPKPEKIEKRDGKLILSQQRLDQLLAQKEADTESKVKAALEADQAAAQQAAERKAAEERGEFQRLYNEALLANQQLQSQLGQLTNAVQSEQQNVAFAQNRVKSYEELIDASVDAKIASWDDAVKTQDPRRLRPEQYTVAERLQWVSMVETLMSHLAATQPQAQQLPQAPQFPQQLPGQPAQGQQTPIPPAVQGLGNRPGPEPAGPAGTDLEAQLEAERQRFRAMYPFSL